MSKDIIELEKTKNEVEKKAWKALETYFDSKPEMADIDRAKIAVGTLAVIVKSQQLETIERRLIAGKK